jgi:hypothetical protein
MTRAIAPELIAELEQAKVDRARRPPRWNCPRFPVWQCCADGERQRYMRSRCGRTRRYKG